MACQVAIIEVLAAIHDAFVVVELLVLVVIFVAFMTLDKTEASYSVAKALLLDYFDFQMMERRHFCIYGDGDVSSCHLRREFNRYLYCNAMARL